MSYVETSQNTWTGKNPAGKRAVITKQHDGLAGFRFYVAVNGKPVKGGPFKFQTEAFAAADAVT